MTDCNNDAVSFQALGRQQVTGRFDASRISSDGGALLLRELDNKAGVIEQFSQCFNDYRDQRYVEHSVPCLLRQRVFGLMLGYDDLNDAEQLQTDGLLGLACGRADFLGEERRHQRDLGKPLACQSTLNRLELAVPDALDDTESLPRGDKKITFNVIRAQETLIDLYRQAHSRKIPKRVILDLDNTDSILHGEQEGRHYQAYYDNYCYTPLYVFTEDGYVLWSELETCDESPTRNCVHAIKSIVTQLRRDPRWKDVTFVVRGDSGFCRDDLMTWCEENNVYYILGLQKNSRLIKEIDGLLDNGKEIVAKTKEAVEFYHQFSYQTRETWTRERCVSAKAEVLPAVPEQEKEIKSNPRFIVSNLPPALCNDDPEIKYREWYCPRGEMENRIKESQLCLFSDRMSCSRLWSNHLRQWFSTIAYVLTHLLRKFGLKDTKLKNAQGTTMRAKLFKIGATIKRTVRRVWISFSSSHPGEKGFAQCMQALRKMTPLHC